MREVAQMGSSSVAPIIIVIAVVLVGLFTASWFRRIERQLKETRKILGELDAGWTSYVADIATNEIRICSAEGSLTRCSETFSHLPGKCP